MKTKTIKLAIEALKEQAQVFAVDANLYEEHLSTVPHAENAYNERRKIFMAIAELQNELKESPIDKVIKRAQEIADDENMTDGWEAFLSLWEFAGQV